MNNIVELKKMSKLDSNNIEVFGENLDDLIKWDLV